MKFYYHRYKISRIGTFYVTVIRGESCFEKNVFEDTENPHPPTKTRLPVKEYLGKYSRYRKISYFVLKLLLRPISFHGKLIFDNLTYFKLYGNLKTLTETYVYYFILPKTRKIVFLRLIIHPNSRNKSISFISMWNQVNK